MYEYHLTFFWQSVQYIQSAHIMYHAQLYILYILPDQVLSYQATKPQLAHGVHLQMLSACHTERDHCCHLPTYKHTRVSKLETSKNLWLGKNVLRILVQDYNFECSFNLISNILL